MDSDTGSGNFGFAFNDPRFSDRILSIEIMPDPVETAYLSTLTPNSSTEPRGNEATRKDDDADRSEDVSVVLRTNTVHINSAILAAKSLFFYKLFSNGMVESEQQVATLRIHASEEVALMELLNFMYNNTLSPTTPSCLLDVLMAADKYAVASCMQYCSQQLGRFPMTLNFALSCLDLPSSVLHIAVLQQLSNSAKQFIVSQFRDVLKFKTQVLELPLPGLEAILSSVDIQVPSEGFVYDLVLKWAEIHYPLLEERREVLERRLRHLIRFSYMTSRKLFEVTRGNNFSPEVASEIVLKALLFKTEIPYIQRQLRARAYLCWPIQMVELVLPHHHCVVYLDLKREDCICLSPLKCIISERFRLGGEGFFLSACCNMDRLNQCFGLFLGAVGTGSVAVDYEVASWLKEIENYKTHVKSSITVRRGTRTIGGCIFKTTWDAFIANDSPYFINGILHLRAIVSIKRWIFLTSYCLMHLHFQA